MRWSKSFPKGISVVEAAKMSDYGFRKRQNSSVKHFFLIERGGIVCLKQRLCWTSSDQLLLSSLCFGHNDIRTIATITTYNFQSMLYRAHRAII